MALAVPFSFFDGILQNPHLAMKSPEMGIQFVGERKLVVPRAKCGGSSTRLWLARNDTFWGEIYRCWRR